MQARYQSGARGVPDMNEDHSRGGRTEPGVSRRRGEDDPLHELWVQGVLPVRCVQWVPPLLRVVASLRFSAVHPRAPGSSGRTHGTLSLSECRIGSEPPDNPRPNLPSTYIVTFVPSLLRDDVGSFREFAGDRLPWIYHQHRGCALQRPLTGLHRHWWCMASPY